MGKITITNEYIDFSGLEDISQVITICLHNRNAILINNWFNPNLELKKYGVCLDSQFKLYDLEFIQIFKARQITNNTIFHYHNHTYYQISS